MAEDRRGTARLLPALGLAALAALAALQPASADYYDGLEAYRAGDHATALREWLPLAQDGDAEARYRVGTLFGDLDGDLRDDVEAARWFELAGEQGHRQAQGRLGRLYEAGRGVEPDDARAVLWYRRSALQGIVPAQYDLGRMYDAGRGVEEAPEVAVSWFRRAAEEGYAAAQLRLGLAFETGRGAALDAGKAARWYRRAAKQGLDEAQLRLGLLFDSGRGVERDRSKAALWYRRAAEGGRIEARRNLAGMYVRGEGVPLDYDEALYWLDLPVAEAGLTATADLFRDEGARELTAERVRELRAAEAHRRAPSASATGEVLVPDDTGSAQVDGTTVGATAAATVAELPRETAGDAATPVDAETLYRRGRDHMLGEGVALDRDEAERLYREAAALGHGMACYRLGFLFYRGRNASGRRDPVEAWAWFSLAAEREVGDAARWRDEVAANFSADDKTEAIARLELLRGSAP